ncbi:COQ9 family protein [Rhodovibrionaceae bacterium A322]
MSLQEDRQALLEAALAHVPFDGWGAAVLQAAGDDLGWDPARVKNTFPSGPRELIECFSDRIDLEMLQSLEAEDLESMKIRDRITLAVRRRLELLEPHREATSRGLSFLSLPLNAPLGARLAWRTVDAIWYAAGDTSTDYNYYSKRSLLLGVYSSTLLCWLNDNSEGYATTWAFLDRRIEEVLKVGGRFGKGMKRLMDLPDQLCQPNSELRRRFNRSPLARTPGGLRR